jgi:hypothetical protein
MHTRKTKNTSAQAEMINEPQQFDPQKHIVKAWFLACHVDTDAATMIAEQLDQNSISAEQTLTALYSVATSNQQLISYS